MLRLAGLRIFACSLAACIGCGRETPTLSTRAGYCPALVFCLSVHSIRGRLVRGFVLWCAMACAVPGAPACMPRASRSCVSAHGMMCAAVHVCAGWQGSRQSNCCTAVEGSCVSYALLLRSGAVILGGALACCLLLQDGSINSKRGCDSMCRAARRAGCRVQSCVRGVYIQRLGVSLFGCTHARLSPMHCLVTQFCHGSCRWIFRWMLQRWA